MTHPHNAVAVLHDVAARLVKIGVDDLLNVRLRAHGVEPTMTVRLEVPTPLDADTVAAEFGLPAASTGCPACGQADHSCSPKYKRQLELLGDGQFIVASDDVSVYVVCSVEAPRVPATVVGAA